MADVYDWVGFEADCWALDCLDDETVVALAEGALEGDARTEALRHVESCIACSALVGQAARLGSGDRPQLGRYRIVEQIGVGGMGRVYLAYDPTLEREVALKLLDLGALDPAVGSARLVKEAQTLAALNHPAICRVFDTQHDDDTVFIAMELVRGRTLAAWLGARPDPAAIVNVFVQAGEGLAAAHAAGVVHRDFKPTNVMVADDERVVVLDFGLARRERVPDTQSDDDHEPSAPEIAGRRTGSAFAGTPIYMAPEQHRGVATAQSDQYAFCLAMVEAFARRFPFAKLEVNALRRAKADKALVDDVVADVPAGVRAALLRGLEPEPSARWPSMRELLDALRAPPRQRWPLLAGVAAVAVVGVAAVYVLGRPPAVECDRADEGVAAVWNETRRAEVNAAIVGSGALGSAEIAARVDKALDAQAQRIATAYRDACHAAHDDTAEPEASFDAHARCLDHRLRELDSAAAVLRELDAKQATNALAVVDDLAPVERCDAASVAEAVPEDPRIAERVEAAELDLARAESELDLGRNRESLAIFEHVVEEARGSEYDPLLARALAGLAANLRMIDDPRVVDVAKEAHTRARLVRDSLSAGRAANELSLVFRRRGELTEAAKWVEEAELDADAADDPELRARVLEAKAALEYSNNEFADALVLRREALELYPAFDDDGLDAALAQREVGNTLMRLERFDEAIEVLQAARTTAVDIVGPDNVRVAELEGELGTAYMMTGQLALAIPYFERGLPSVAQQEGEMSRSMFSARARLAALYREAGRFEDSAEQSRLGIVMLEKLEHSPREAAIVWMNLGKTKVKLNDLPGALEALEKARGIIESAAEGEAMRPLLAMNLEDIATVLAQLGREDEAAKAREQMLKLAPPQ